MPNGAIVTAPVKIDDSDPTYAAYVSVISTHDQGQYYLSFAYVGQKHARDNTTYLCREVANVEGVVVDDPSSSSSTSSSSSSS